MERGVEPVAAPVAREHPAGSVRTVGRGGEPDDDGRMRVTRFVHTDGVNTYVSLPVAVAADAFGAEKLELSPSKLKLGSREIPINPEGDVEIDFRTHQANRAGKRLDFTSREVELLRYLVSRAGQVVTREQILNDVWGYEDSPTTRTIARRASNFTGACFRAARPKES